MIVPWKPNTDNILIQDIIRLKDIENPKQSFLIKKLLQVTLYIVRDENWDYRKIKDSSYTANIEEMLPHFFDIDVQANRQMLRIRRLENFVL